MKTCLTHSCPHCICQMLIKCKVAVTWYVPSATMKLRCISWHVTGPIVTEVKLLFLSFLSFLKLLKHVEWEEMGGECFHGCILGCGVDVSFHTEESRSSHSLSRQVSIRGKTL